MTRLQRLSQRVLALEITAFVIASMLLLLAHLSQSTIKEYWQSGLLLRARVIDKRQVSRASLNPLRYQATIQTYTSSSL